MKQKKPIKQRLKEKSIEQDQCQIYLGATNNAGYGMFRFAKGKMMTAHKASYIEHNGPVPDGLHVCHTCDNKLCINPNHLQLMTIRENFKRRISEGRKYCRNTPLKRT